MSYCRWSSDDWRSDVYVYEDVSGGWTTHVAGNRVVPAEPLPDRVPFDLDNLTPFLARDRAVMSIIERSPRTKIGLPFDGQSFNDPTPGDCAQRLVELRTLGYHVPEGVIEELFAEDEGHDGDLS